MIWETKGPKLFETKIVKRFAWLPTDIGDITVWFCFYWQKLRWQDGGYYEPDESGHGAGQLYRHWDFDKYGPRCYGTYIYGPIWETIATSLKKEDLPVSLLDNYQKAVA